MSKADVPVAFMFNTHNHSVSASYDSEKHTWLLVEPNHLGKRMIPADQDLAKMLLQYRFVS